MPFRPRNRTRKEPLLKFPSHFTVHQDEEYCQYYRCVVCTNNPVLMTLREAVKHERTPDHKNARRPVAIDRTPSPIFLNPIPRTVDNEDLKYIPNLVPASLLLDFSLYPVDATAPNPSRDQGSAMGGYSAGWHYSPESPSSHLTAPASSLLHNLFGAAGEDLDHPDGKYEKLKPGSVPPEVLEPFKGMHFEEPPLPPALPMEEMDFNPWACAEHDYAHEFGAMEPLKLGKDRNY